MKVVLFYFTISISINSFCPQPYLPTTHHTERNPYTLATAVLDTTITHQFIIEDSVLITTRSGATLTAQIARQKDASLPLPTIIMYSIYAGARNLITLQEIAAKGYVGVIVNTRGKYLGTQTIEPFEHDADDAYDMIDWVSKHPWCNGSVGMFGGSYLGFSQWSALKKIHPALKTIVPQVAVGVGIDFPMYSNIFMSYMLQWIHYVSNNKLTDATDFFDSEKWRKLYSKWYISGKSFRSLDSLEGHPNKIFQRWLNHPAYDSFWYNMVPYRDEYAKINIPILTITGYFDDDQRGALYYFNQHHLYNKNATHYLVIGPYDHSGAQHTTQQYLNGYLLDSAANININDLVFLWFDHILKQGAKPSLLKDKINYQIMGSNSWKHAPSLDKMNNDTILYYLSNTHKKNYYQLKTNPPKVKENIFQKVSYTDRDLETTGPAELAIIASALQIKDALTFMSEPLVNDMDLNGSFSGELKFTINKKDLDISVMLYELQPDSTYFLLSTFLTRASFAKDRSKRQLLKPGREESIVISNSFFVSKHLQKGSRVVVLIGMNKKRDWQINYGTGKDVSDETIHDGAIPLKIKWSNGSTIKLPVYHED